MKKAHPAEQREAGVGGAVGEGGAKEAKEGQLGERKEPTNTQETGCGCITLQVSLRPK